MRLSSPCIVAGLSLCLTAGGELENKPRPGHLRSREMALTLAETSAGSPWAPTLPGWPGCKKKGVAVKKEASKRERGARVGRWHKGRVGEGKRGETRGTLVSQMAGLFDRAAWHGEGLLHLSECSSGQEPRRHNQSHTHRKPPLTRMRRGSDWGEGHGCK